MKMRMQWIVSILVITTFLISVSAVAMLPAPASGKGKGEANGLEKIVFIHHEKGFAKPPCNNDGVCEPGEKKSCADCRNGGGESESKCYTFLGKGVKWNDLPTSYVIHPDLEAIAPGAISVGAETWDAATSTELLSGYVLDSTATWDSNVRDGRNEMVFGDYPEARVIAVTVIWGYFSGPPSQRKIVEFDILFDTDFIWGNATLNSSVMDLQNIATHEIGHGLGLGDLYNTGCAEETMYGYSKYGETNKRTLESGDVTGIHKLYGA